MKKILFIFAAFAVLSLASCNKIENTETSLKKITGITFSIGDKPGTKAVKKNWEKGDEIMIFFAFKAAVGQQAKIRYDGNTWQIVQEPQNLTYPSGTNIGKYFAIHYPGEIVYNGPNQDPSQDNRHVMNYRAGVILWEHTGKDFNVSEAGVIELGTITLKKISTTSLHVVVPGIIPSDGYTLSVTCNGKYISAENNFGRYLNSYAQGVKYPFFEGFGILCEDIFSNVYGVSNPDGTEFFFSYRDASLPPMIEAAASPYKYVFALSDGTQLYYYTKDNTYADDIANKHIKLRPFDGKGAKLNWKTTLE